LVFGGAIAIGRTFARGSPSINAAARFNQRTRSSFDAVMSKTVTPPSESCPTTFARRLAW
jgi:hypothetical protein